MKFLITSDNHLGYKEKDSVRSLDSFVTFEEILQVATKLDVDFILQGGDLFHDNLPSRNTLVRTISLCKEYLLGDKEITFSTNIELNTNDPNMNIAIPFIAIHGNHDDPSGIFHNSSLEILKSCGLINYIGKFSSITQLEVEPVLIFRNNKKVAIYAIGNIKDRRLHKMFVDKKVSFKRPVDFETYVNILVLHQNRVKRFEDDYVPPEIIDDWFDVIVYGHEHNPVMYQDNRGVTIIQCGSTVRTSLCEGELGDKFVYIMELENEIKIDKISLKSVRPFLMHSIKINDNKETEITKYVDKMIEGFYMPLVRLRVETTGESVNKIKFGMNYKDRIANCNEILLFTKKRKPVNDIEKKSENQQKNDDVLESLYKNLDLKALPEKLVIENLKKFIENNDKNIFNDLVKYVVKNTVESLNKDVLNHEDIEKQLLAMKKTYQNK
ncbi:hypothetical protein BDAP_001643 [Binucleata daphniae]